MGAARIEVGARGAARRIGAHADGRADDSGRAAVDRPRGREALDGLVERGLNFVHHHKRSWIAVQNRADQSDRSKRTFTAR